MKNKQTDISTVEMSVHDETPVSRCKLSRRRSIIREFSLNTSTHGFPSIARSQSILNRLFWILATMMFAIVMLYFVVKSVNTYFTYPTQTSVSIVVERSQPFPAVSICNYSPIRFDRFIGPFLNFTNFRNLTNTTDNSTISPEQANFIQYFIQDWIQRDQSLTDFLFPLESMLLGCTYNGRPCNSSDFLPFLSAIHGLCYTFNAQRVSDQRPIHMTSDFGDSGKLVLQLYAHSHQYVPYISGDVSVGMVAMIHDNTELPLIEVAGIHLSPGRRHKMTYKKRTYHLLPPPYTKCTETIPPVMRIYFDQYQGAKYSYSQDLCNMLCVLPYVFEACKCVDPALWNARSVILPGTNEVIKAPLCDVVSACYLDAKSRIIGSTSTWDEFCSNCTEACFTVDFIVTISSASAPANTYLRGFKQQVESSSIPVPVNWSTTWINQIENNYVSLEIVAENGRVEKYEQNASITVVDLISNIGGQSGLWIGISFLSIMELVELFYRLFRLQFYHIRDKIKMIREKKLEQDHS